MTDRSFRLALAQTSPLLGDVAGNAECVRAARGRAAAAGADLVLFPDGVLAGGAAGGLVHRPAFLDACRRACEDLARETVDGGPALLLGLPWVEGGALYDAQALLDGGVIQAVRFKVRIGEAGASAFRPGPLPGPVPFRGLLRLGLVPGEDLADEEVPECLAETGAELLLACDAALYRRGGADRRLNRAVARVVETDLPLVWLNAVGAGKAGVCDGASFVLAADRSLTHHLPAFRETLVVTQWIRRDGVWTSEPGEVAAIETGDEADYAACMLGLREHVRLTRATGAVLELSNSASALCAALAVDALGPKRVEAVLLAGGEPGEAAPADAAATAAVLGLAARTMPMAGLIGALDVALPASGAQATPDRMDVARAALLTALARGMDRTLLAPSPRFGASGAAAVIGDLNPVGDLSPAEIDRLLELRRGWKPVGALGPDRLLLPALPVAPEEQPRDAILSALAAGQRIAEIVAAGHDAATVMALQEEQRSAADPRRAAPRIRLTESLDEAAVRHGFVDRGEPANEPDATLVRGIGRPGADSIDF
ncbi:NAD+ synthase [Bosea sp. OAE506]|uniref:nitrilase-related carbon-nitrogen hydrolase n=1 Tax=Bosea sp. OAE506 TaxID=2663870 RepID=UPI00178A8C08